MAIELKEHTACESQYTDNVTGEKLRLWAIVGGTLAVAFANYEFTERLNYSEKFDSSKDSKWPTWEGPRLSDVEGGEARIQAWLEKSMALRAIRQDRFKQVSEILHSVNPYRVELVSSRFHDFGNCTYVWYKLEFTSARVGIVRADSARYCGCAESEEVKKWGNAKWQALTDFFRQFIGNAPSLWEELSEEVFGQVLDTLRRYQDEV
jgi:hypothetical protein